MAKIDSKGTISRIYIATLIRVPIQEFNSSDIHSIPHYLTEDKLFKSMPVRTYPLSFLIAKRQRTKKNSLRDETHSFFSSASKKKQPGVSLEEYCRLESEEGATHYWNAPNRGLGLTADDASLSIRDYCRRSQVEVIFEVDTTVLTEAQKELLLNEAAERKSMSVKIPPEAIRMAEFSHTVRVRNTEQTDKVELLPLQGVILNSDTVPPVTASPTPKCL